MASRRKRVFGVLSDLYEEYGAPIVDEVVEALGMGAGEKTVREAVKRRAAEKPAAKKPTPKKPAPKKPRRTMTQAPDLRSKSRDEAVKIARGEPHLIQSKDGQYVGAPRGVKTRKDLRVMRENFDRDVAAGAKGGDWYERARADNVELAGPDPAKQRLLAREQALFSAQANPDTNLNFALQAHNAYEMGNPRDIVRTGQQARTYREARDAGADISLGPKTGIYAQHLDPTVEPATTGTNDIWHARGFGYTNPDGSTFSKALSDQEHRFLDYETMLAVDRANQAGLAGRSDWTGAEVQAAPWVAGKGRSLAQQKAGKGREPTPEQIAAGIAEASKTYPDFVPKYTANATSERIPYIGSGHLTGLNSASYEDRLAYSRDPRASYTEDNGRDIIYDALGAYQRPTREATGFYKPPEGPPEMNPAVVAKPLVGLTDGGIDPNSRNMLDLAEMLRAYNDAQGAGAYHTTLTNAPGGELNAVRVPMEGQVGGDTLTALQELGARYGLPDVIDTGDGVTMTSFDFDNPPLSRDIAKALRGSMSEELSQYSSGVPKRVKVDGGYQQAFEGAGGEGSGIATGRLVEMLKAQPESVIDKLDESESLRRRYAAGAELDDEMAAKYGSTRQDIQAARRIMADKGLRGLIEAYERGDVPLPAIMPFVGVGAASLAQEEEPGA